MLVPLLLSLSLGLGVYLLYDGLTRPPTAPSQRDRWRALREFLVRAGLPGVTPRDFAVFALASGLGLAAVAQLLLGWVAVTVLVALAGVTAPITYYARRHNRRRAAVQAALTEAITQLRDAIRSGFSVQEALAGLATTGPEALRGEFGSLAREMRLAGFVPALVAMRERLADPAFDVVVSALLLNERVGGRNVSQVLDRLAQAVRGELRVQQEVRAYQSETVVAARFVAAVPLVLLVAIRQMNPGYLSIFNGAGQFLLVGSLVSIAVGYGAMLWVTRLPGEARVLQ
ncbi:MAG: type II secretion system F family protein [Chloroflexota bacterium]